MSPAPLPFPTAGGGLPIAQWKPQALPSAMVRSGITLARQKAGGVVTPLQIIVQAIPLADWQIEQIRPYLLDWLGKLGAAGNRLYRKTVASWTSPKPRFKVEKATLRGTRAAARLSVYFGTHSSRYKAVDQGVKAFAYDMPGAFMDETGKPVAYGRVPVERLVKDEYGKEHISLVFTKPKNVKIRRMAFIVPWQARTTPGKFASGGTSGGSQGYPGKGGYNPNLRRTNYIRPPYASRTGKANKYGDNPQAWYVMPRHFTDEVAKVISKRMKDELEPTIRTLAKRITKPSGRGLHKGQLAV